ncbi:hypothetical protein Hanom_Chr09g00834251 [Helianthus anomalus]
MGMVWDYQYPARTRPIAIPFQSYPTARPACFATLSEKEMEIQETGFYFTTF